MRKIVLFCLFCLLSLPSFGQDYFLFFFQNGQVDNLSWCVTNDCWQQINQGSTTFVQSSVGADGTVMGVDANHDVWVRQNGIWTEENSWSIQGKVASIHPVADQQALALTTASQGNIYVTLDGGEVWVQIDSSSECTDASMDGNNNIWCVGTDSNIWYAPSLGSFYKFVNN